MIDLAVNQIAFIAFVLGRTMVVHGLREFLYVLSCEIQFILTLD